MPRFPLRGRRPGRSGFTRSIFVAGGAYVEPPSGIIVAIGQAVETDSVTAVVKIKYKTVGQNSETDTSQPITRVKTKAIGQPSETDTTTALTKVKRKTLGQPSETDTNTALTKRKTKVIGQTDSPFDPVIDNFTGSNGTIDSRVAQNGDTWHVGDGTVAIASNQIGSSYGGAQLDGPYGPNVFVSVDVVTPPTGTSANYLQVYARNTGTQLYALLLYPNSETDNWSVAINNPFAWLWRESRTVSAGDKIGLEITGNRVRTWHYTAGMWTLVTDVADNTISAAGSIGFVRDPTGGGSIVIDNFSGGTAQISAQPITRQHVRTLGQSSETDTAQAITEVGADIYQIGQTTETDTVTAITKRKIKTLGQNTETDTSQPITRQKVRAIGQVSETDTSQPISKIKTKVVGQTTETDTAQAITADYGLTTVSIGQASETDSAQAVTRIKYKSVAQTTETDAAFGITDVGADIKLLGQASETDTTTAITRQKIKAIGQASETDTSQPFARIKTKAIGQTTETDSTTALTRRKLKTLGQPSETDSAQGITDVGADIKLLGQATETDTNTAITKRKIKSIGQASETDTAQAISEVGADVYSIGQASETDSVTAISKTKIKSIGQASETDTAQAIAETGADIYLIGQAVETDEAQAITETGANTVVLGQTTETDTNTAINRQKIYQVGNESGAQFSDDFNRSDENLDAPWVQAGDGTGAVDNNFAVNGTPGTDSYVYYDGAASSDDHFAEIVVGPNDTPGDLSDWQSGPAVRVSSGKNAYFVNPNFQTLTKIVGGSYTDLGNVFVGAGIGDPDDYRNGDICRIEVVGDTIRVFITRAGFFDNVEVPASPFTDSSLTTGQPGMRLWNGEVDDWQGGDLTAPATIEETDSAQPLDVTKIKAIGQATESDTAQALTKQKTKAIGQATETDTANAITEFGADVYALGQSSETDSSGSISKIKYYAIGQATETDTAQNIASRATITVTLGQASETDEILDLSSQHVYPIGMAEEGGIIEVPVPVPVPTPDPGAGGSGGTPWPSSTVLHASQAPRVVAVGVATESEFVFSIQPVLVKKQSEPTFKPITRPKKVVPIGMATENDHQLSLSVRTFDFHADPDKEINDMKRRLEEELLLLGNML